MKAKTRFIQMEIFVLNKSYKGLMREYTKKEELELHELCNNIASGKAPYLVLPTRNGMHYLPKRQLDMCSITLHFKP